MKKLDIAVVVTVAIFTCLLLCTPALADYNNDGWPVVTRESGSIHGGMIVPLGSSEKADLIVTEIKACHNNTNCPAWFNLSNEIGVTVKNNGSTPAEASNVSLYIDGEFFGSLPVSSLAAGANETVTFENWKPIGDDCLKTIDNICYFNWSFRDYNITAVADCDNEVAESNETNNERSVFGPEKTRACYNGYMADEPLENVAHGTLHGALFFTTGDGVYSCLYSVSDTQVTNYDITLPETATVILADLNVYYRWTEPSEACPEMEVSIETTTGTYVLPLERAYNDMNCTCPGASCVSAWGNYVYNLTGYITGSGTYTVTVKNKCIEECKYFCTAAPGIALVYEDENAPLIEYRVNRGADVLLGGRSDPMSVNLCWEECINNATFSASAETGEVANATLGVVSSWGSAERDPGMTNYLFFNDLKLGTGVYHGYNENYDVSIASISMHIGSLNAQVGVNVTNVTAHYLHGCDNVVGQADDGDNMMPANAFLVVNYKMPDLVITNKTEAFGDCDFNVTYTIANVGDGDADASQTTIYINGAPYDFSTPAIAKGESHENTVGPFECACGATLKVIVCADKYDEVDESDETNNCAVNIIECPSTKVDILADGIAGTIFDVSGYSICPGTVTEDGITIKNKTAMGAVVIYCQNNGINVQITIGALGEYLLQIGNDLADYNNWMYAVNDVTPPVGGAQKEIVDGDRVHWYNYKLHYYVVLTTLDKTEIEVGENLTATVSWKDMGGTHPLKGASVYVGAMGSGGPETGTHVGTTGADGTCTFSWYNPGEWGVYAVDPIHGSGQYNMPYVSFTCRTGGKPDLVINKTVSFSDSTFTVNYTLTNIGIVRANESTTCKYLDGVLMESQSCPALDPGESHKGTFDPEPCPCGSIFNVTVCADRDNVINESDETNNCEVNIITCPSTMSVDLRAEGMGGTIFNAPGYPVCPGTVTQDGFIIDNETAMGVLVNYCQNNDINVEILIFSIGLYILQIGSDQADYNNWMYAINEVPPQVGADVTRIVDGDRELWYNYKLHYYAVLTTLDKTEIFCGESITATVTWKGMDGTQPLSGATVYVGTMGPWGPEPGTPVGTTGADGTCTFSWPDPGEWGIYAVDPVHGSGQYNWPYVSFTCRTGGKPDLVINKTVSFSASTFTVNYAVTNIGIVRANESTTCKYLDGVLMGSQSCPALDPGESHNGAFDPEPCPGGSTLNVTACADNNNVVNESDETNNCEVNIITCSSTTSVDLRADGIAGTIFDVSGYSIFPGTVTADGLTIDNETAMGALVSYCQNNGLNVQIAIGALDEYVVQIGNDPADNDNWMYAVNEEVPPVGGAQKVIFDGDRVHWYNYNLYYYEVLTAIDKTEIEVGENLTATVSWKDMGGTHPLKGASVYVGAMGSGGPEPGTHVGTTGADGTCTFSWSNPGEWGVYAVDPAHGSGQYNWPYVTFTCRTGGKPDLEVNKTAFPTEGTVGTDVKFTLNVTNTGNCTLNPVRVADTLPAGMSYVATGTTPAPSSVVGNEVTWNNVSSLDPSDSTIITLIAHIDEGASGTLINDVNATGTPPYGADVHDSDTATVTVMNVSISISITKSCSPTTVAPGGIVTYTINCSNSGVANLTNVTITENYPEGVTFISADPASDPGTNNMWTIGVLPVGKFRTITIKVKVPDSRDISFTETGSVTGEGFVMVSKELSTEHDPYTLKNVVTIECAETDPVTASAFTIVSGVPGTSLEITEHGSGMYTSEELLNLETKNKSISLQKSTEAEYLPTSFNFSDSFSVNFTTLWKQDICSKNMVLGDAMHKKIKDATYIMDDTETEMGAYGTSMEFDSSFYGAAHIGAVSKDVTTSEDYIGEFEIYWATREECRYLFNWSQVPGNDSEKLIRYLVDVLAIKWAENATITKSSDDRIIHISTDGRSAEIVMGANNETATVKVGAETIYVLEVRTEDGTLKVYDCRLKEMSESVTGVGYVMVDKVLSKGQMQVVEHGSGNYASDTVFDSHQLDKDTEAEYMPTAFNFSGDFDVNFSSKWVQGICTKNEKAGTAIHKKISYAASMADDTNATKSTMKFESSFNGSMHIGVRTNNTKISEDYIGEFYVAEVIEIRDKNVTSQKEEEEEWMECP